MIDSVEIEQRPSIRLSELAQDLIYGKVAEEVITGADKEESDATEEGPKWAENSTFPRLLKQRPLKRGERLEAQRLVVAQHNSKLRTLENQAKAHPTDAARLKVEKAQLAFAEEMAKLVTTRSDDDTTDHLFVEILGRSGVITVGDKQAAIEAVGQERRLFEGLDHDTRSEFASFLGGSGLVEVEVDRMEGEALEFYGHPFFEDQFRQLREFTGYVISKTAQELADLPEAS